MLWCLPLSKWGPKIITTKEAQDLRTLSLDDLLEKLTTHELTLNNHGENDIIPSTKKSLKSKKLEESLIRNDESDDEEDLVTLIKRGLDYIIRMKKKYKNFKSRNRDLPNWHVLNVLVHFVRDCPQKNGIKKQD